MPVSGRRRRRRRRAGLSPKEYGTQVIFLTPDTHCQVVSVAVARKDIHTAWIFIFLYNFNAFYWDVL